MGRRKDHTLVSYSEASTWSQSEYIGSRRQYWAWIDREHPQGLPKYPNRVYSEWSSWNNFLSNDNEFANANPHQYRPYGEALVYAQASGIKKATEWFKFDHPDDIPIRPEFVYRSKGWLGWYSFLGTGPQSITHKVAARQQAKELGLLVLYIAHGNPSNVVSAVVAPGREAAVERATKDHSRIIRMFKMEDGYDWRAVMGRHGSQYEEGQWIVSNVNELVWEYSNDLIFVN